MLKMLKTSFPKAVVLTALLLGLATSASAGPLQRFFAHKDERSNGSTEMNSVQPSEHSAPPSLPAGAKQIQNLAYGTDPLQRMDVYIPPNAKQAAVIFMVHGGAWMFGDKGASSVVQNKIHAYLPKGYLLISVNYRLVPQVPVMTEADDVAQALAYAQRHAAEWGADPAKFIVMGHSAGAHLVALLSATPSIVQGAGVRPWLGTIALDSAAYSVVDIMRQPHMGFYDKAFGNDTQLWQQASPLLQLKSAPLPMLLVCSSRRKNSCSQASDFVEKAQSLGGRVTVFPVDLSHSDINRTVGLAGELTEKIDSFLQSLTVH